MIDFQTHVRIFLLCFPQVGMIEARQKNGFVIYSFPARAGMVDAHFYLYAQALSTPAC